MHSALKKTPSGIFSSAVSFKMFMQNFGPIGLIFWVKVKKSEKTQILNNICLIMHATDTIFNDKVCITLPKLHVNFHPNALKDFFTKCKKCKTRIKYA